MNLYQDIRSRIEENLGGEGWNLLFIRLEKSDF